MIRGEMEPATVPTTTSRDPIRIVRYDPAWPASFEREAGRVREAMGELAVRIDHVGSTAVPGLAAKPVIDVQVSVVSLRPEGPYRVALARAGYVYGRQEEDERRFFKRNEEHRERPVRAAHVHVCQAGGEWEEVHLRFRDVLRSNPGVSADYARLKRRLAREFPLDPDGYTNAKDPFIQSVLDRFGEHAGAKVDADDRSGHG
jgi:GrpB-like predicted nucleotidyltransferase (UPF0157 family)